MEVGILEPPSSYVVATALPSFALSLCTFDGATLLLLCSICFPSATSSMSVSLFPPPSMWYSGRVTEFGVSRPRTHLALLATSYVTLDTSSIFFSASVFLSVQWCRQWVRLKMSVLEVLSSRGVIAGNEARIPPSTREALSQCVFLVYTSW